MAAANSVGNITGGTAAPAESVRQMAVAKVASVGRGGFGPEPGRQGGKQTLQGRTEQQNRNERYAARREQRQDEREAHHSGVYTGGAQTNSGIYTGHGGKGTKNTGPYKRGESRA